MRIWSAAVLLAGLALYGCNSSTKETNETASKPLAQGSIRLQRFGKCDTTGNGRGVSVKTEVWEPADSSEAATAIRQALNQKLVDRINQHGDSAVIAQKAAATKSVSGAFDLFEKNYKDFIKDFPEAPGCWEVNLTGDTVMVTSKMLFYQLDHYAFVGGAHPNTFRSYHAFDAESGKEVDMERFVKDSTALLQIVEKYFRQTEKLGADTDLENAGYFLLNHRFFAPANYVPTREGVLFYYNPYEISTYARGAIHFTIPYNELGKAFDQQVIF